MGQHAARRIVGGKLQPPQRDLVVIEREERSLKSTSADSSTSSGSPASMR